MELQGWLQYQTVLPRCPKCGKYGQAYSTMRISVTEMESYYRFLGVCQETESTTVRSMNTSLHYYAELLLFENRAGTF